MPTNFTAKSPVSTVAPVPARLYDCDLLIPVLECFMIHTIRRNELKERADAYERRLRALPPPEPSVFHALQPPSITPVEYLLRLARYSFCSRSVFVAAFYYLERIAALDAVDLIINSLSLHRLLLTAVLLATKVFDDVLYDNAHFAKVGGLDVKELNMLELDMLKVLNFRVHISADDFEAFERKLLSSAMESTDSDYVKLRYALTNLGYANQIVLKRPPASPTSSMDVCFSRE